MADELLGIGEVAAKAGLRHSALHYYEAAGLIAPAERRGARRFFHPSVLQRLTLIGHLQAVGFTIEEIGTILGGRGRRARWRSVAERKLAELDEHIERARATRRILAAALECGCGDPTSCELVTGTRAIIPLGRRLP